MSVEDSSSRFQSAIDTLKNAVTQLNTEAETYFSSEEVTWKTYTREEIDYFIDSTHKGINRMNGEEEEDEDEEDEEEEEEDVSKTCSIFGLRVCTWSSRR